MNPISLVFLSFAMSTDAFAAAIGKGATLYKPQFLQALRIGILFGLIEASITLLGWLIGNIAASFIEQWDHWLAFFLLLALGIHMIYSGMKEDGEEGEPDAKTTKQSFYLVALTAVATSIDSLAVGIGLAFIQVNIWVAAGAIGTATLVMVTLGVLLGKAIGSVVGRRAEIIGGVILILVGAAILYEHLSA